MTATFDQAASTYDEVFTNSHTGRMQRNQVRKFLEASILKRKNLNILEINCGTGEDALYFASKGHRVIATDISSEMIKVAENKLNDSELTGEIEFKNLSIEESISHFSNIQFDLVFSNFGGINCLEPESMDRVVSSIPKILNSSGSFIAVIMPKHCMIESLYFFLKGNFKNVFRRNTEGPIIANVDGIAVPTYYYDPKNLTRQKNLDLRSSRPIGFFLPPSYMEGFIQPKKVLMKVLFTLENIFNHFSFLSRFSDHFYIDLKKR